MSVEHWETYYRGGGLVTCPTGPESNYTLEAREVWAEFLAGLPEGARVVDLCTGNGPIPLIAKEVAEAAGRRFEIHGVDLAQIAPERHVKDGAKLFEGIRFHPGTSAEHLPFETASVDAVTGQYALEYTDAPKVLAEVARVLRPGGRAQFVTHNRDSVVVRNAGPTFVQFHVLFEETRLLRKLRRFLELERESPDRARSAARELDLALRHVEAVLASTSFAQPALVMARDTVRRTLAARRVEPASRLNAAVDGVERELRASWRRLQDLDRCALDDAGIARIEQLASVAGLETEGRAPLLHAGQNVIGWRLTLRRLS